MAEAPHCLAASHQQAPACITTSCGLASGKCSQSMWFDLLYKHLNARKAPGAPWHLCMCSIWEGSVLIAFASMHHGEARKKAKQPLLFDLHNIVPLAACIRARSVLGLVAVVLLFCTHVECMRVGKRETDCSLGDV
jgi:hypothetical protein